MSLYRIVSFDTLHVWKLGVLRLLAQRLPAMLSAVCGRDSAVHGSVEKTLLVANLRGFELGRLCRASPSAPGCFVPSTVAQPSMKGRHWRHFCVEWPHILTGLIGPAFFPIGSDAPEGFDGVPHATADASHDEDEAATERADSGDVDDLDVSLEPRNVLTPAYRRAYGVMKVEDAVLDMFCMAAKLNGLFFGDNVKDPTMTSETDAEAMATLARELGTAIQVLLSPLDTTKLHRLMFHLSQELQNRGNLWEGDTSENESLHSSVKQMFKRTNNHGPTLLLQMLRSEETQAEVLQSLEREERRAERDASVGGTGLGGPVPEEGDEEAQRLRIFRRGIRITLASVSARSGLSSLAIALGVDPSQSLIVANTIIVRAKLEWRARGVPQHIRGADNFRGSPWYSYIRYRNDGGELCWGMVRVVLRAVGDSVRTCVVVQCMRPARPRRGCVLSKYGCQRLRWDFAHRDDEWPRLAVVNPDNMCRLEQVHVDWQDHTDRVGLAAMPSTMPDTAEERRRTRFFTNVFYPWTCRPLRVIL